MRNSLYRINDFSSFFLSHNIPSYKKVYSIILKNTGKRNYLLAKILLNLFCTYGTSTAEAAASSDEVWVAHMTRNVTGSLSDWTSPWVNASLALLSQTDFLLHPHLIMHVL